MSSVGLISLVSLISSVNSSLIFHSGLRRSKPNAFKVQFKRVVQLPHLREACSSCWTGTSSKSWNLDAEVPSASIWLTFVKKKVVPSPELLTGRTKLVWKNLNDLINACHLETTRQVQNWNMFTLVYSVRALAAFRPNYRVGKFCFWN